MSQLARRENAPHKAAFVTSLSRYSWARDSPQNKAPPPTVAETVRGYPVGKLLFYLWGVPKKTPRNGTVGVRALAVPLMF